MKSAQSPFRLLGAALAVLLPLGSASVNLSAATPERVIRITAHQFAYSEPTIALTRGVPVVLELTSADVEHGFYAPKLGIRANVLPGKVTRVRIVPDKAGSFAFHCDNFCGGGHEEMAGTIIVRD